MSTVGSYEAKTHLPALLKRVEAGESVTITRHGHPIARLVPVTDVPEITSARAVAGLRELQSRNRLGAGLTVRNILRDSRR